MFLPNKLIAWYFLHIYILIATESQIILFPSWNAGKPELKVDSNFSNCKL